MSCSRTQHSASGEYRTSNPSIPSDTRYHPSPDSVTPERSSTVLYHNKEKPRPTLFRGWRCHTGPLPKSYCLWPCSLDVPVLAGLVYGLVVLCPGTPEGSTGSCSGFKSSQKTGQQLKVSSDRLGEAGDPWFTRHMFIPYSTAACQSHEMLEELTCS